MTKETMNTEIDFATATHAELEAAGFTVKVGRSQRTKKARKSLFGVRPSMNKGGRRAPAKIGKANMNTTPGACQG